LERRRPLQQKQWSAKKLGRNQAGAADDPCIFEAGYRFRQEKEYAVADREEMVREFERLWKVRAREGGLREASKLLKDALN
jgi:hypothetical protein